MERKETPLPGKMKETQGMQEALKTSTSDITVKQEDKIQKEETRENEVGIQSPKKQPSSVHFIPERTDPDTLSFLMSQTFSQEMPLSYYRITSAQNSGLSLSSMGPLTSKSTLMSHSRADTSLGKESPSFLLPKKQPLLRLDSETLVLGDGEDYFLSLFGDSKKLPMQSSHIEEGTRKHLSVILEEVGQFTSSSLGDIKIAEVNVKGLFVRLVNSSIDKEMEIGDHILQQNVDGRPVSLYRFLPNITMQASSTVTVWATASEAKPKPPTDFVWEEQSRFRSSPDCTTILCKPNGEAIAWYTPIHWKQAWEKLETDIEFQRCSVAIPSLRSHMFRWMSSVSSISKEEPSLPKKEVSKCQTEDTQPLLTKEMDLLPPIFSSPSPWCRSPYAPPHPFCSLIEPYYSDVPESNLRAPLRSQPTSPDPAPDTKKKKSKSQEK